VKAEGTEEVEVSTKNQLKNQEKLLKNILILLGIIVLLVLGSYIYIQTLRHSTYGEIEFRTANLGTEDDLLIMYETITLADSNDGTEGQFGFRIRTKPSKLKKIPFEGIENFNLMKVNGYSYGEGTFDCEGNGVIAMPNFQRLFQKIGMELVHDENASCDPEGRYNQFNLIYGDKTEIKEVGNRCYDVVIEGNDDSCEILPATEKLMVEIFSKYLAV